MRRLHVVLEWLLVALVVGAGGLTLLSAAARRPIAPVRATLDTPAARGGAAAPASSAKVQTEVLVTSQPGQRLVYVISASGQHVAAVVRG
jgi:hypothetical protein